MSARARLALQWFAAVEQLYWLCMLTVLLFAAGWLSWYLDAPAVVIALGVLVVACVTLMLCLAWKHCGVCRALHEAVRREQRDSPALAFVSGMHARLGNNSPVRNALRLDRLYSRHIVNLILEHARPETVLFADVAVPGDFMLPDDDDF